MTTITGSALRTFLHGERLAHLSDLDRLLDEPEFAPASPASDRERNLRTYARLAAVGRHEGGSVELAADTERLNTVQEWMAVVDPCVSHAGLVHFAVCTWAIGALGRPGAYLTELTADLDRGRAAGSILVTEVGRSNSHIAVATEARFDAQSRTFTLHTPDDGAAKIMANVAEPGVPKIAIVFAQLVVGERRCGLFPFAMRIQTEDGPAQGVRVAALSDVPAVPLDYALVRFDEARVPFDSWLRDSATLDADGVFDDPLGGAAQRLMRSFAFAASAALGASVALAAAARASITIALRHANQRVTSGSLAPGLEVIGYSTQQWALYTALADAYATTFLVEQAKTWYRAGHAGAGARGRADLRALELGESQSRADEGGGRGRAWPGSPRRVASARARRASSPRTGSRSTRACRSPFRRPPATACSRAWMRARRSRRTRATRSTSRPSPGRWTSRTPRTALALPRPGKRVCWRTSVRGCARRTRARPSSRSGTRCCPRRSSSPTRTCATSRCAASTSACGRPRRRRSRGRCARCRRCTA